MDNYNKLRNLGNFSILPKDLKVSTMTLTCAFNTEFNLENISKYLKLKDDGIKSVKHGDIFRTIIFQKKSTRKKNKAKKKKYFYNQATIEIKPENNNEINIKIFNNGSVQMTGCKNTIDVIEVLETLCRELKVVRGVMDLDNSIIVEKPFVTQPEKLSIRFIKDLNIRMINSNFDIGFKINRNALNDILLEEGYETTFEPNVHACVNVKYNYKDRKRVSVFVFASGAVIITGANSCNQIKEAYEFINKKLYNNYKIIRDVSSVKAEDIFKYLNC
jgi:TATA-box binding protein (TBP) (component of TFIID and TFIIIB)